MLLSLDMGKDKTHVNVVGEYLNYKLVGNVDLLHHSHRPRRLRQVDHHRSLDLQVRWYR